MEGEERPHQQARRPFCEQGLCIIHNSLEVVVIKPAQLCSAAQQLHERGRNIPLQLGTPAVDIIQVLSIIARTWIACSLLQGAP